ncbi:MAG: AI-2E family transporter [Wolinella sp.]
MRPIHFFWVMFIFSGYWILYLFRPFLMDMLVALLLCVACMGLKDKIESKVRFSLLGSAISVVMLLALLFVPLIYVVVTLTQAVASIDPQVFSGFIESAKSHILELVALFPLVQEKLLGNLDTLNAGKILQKALAFSATLGRGSVSFITDTVFVSVFLFFFFYYGRAFHDYAMRLIPFSKEQSTRLFGEVSGVLGVVFYSSLASVFLQGILFAVMISFFGYNTFLFGVLYGIASLVPLVGGLLVWLPLALYEYYLGNQTSALFIALYSVIVIATIADNVVKPLLIGLINRVILKSPVQINELVIFFPYSLGSRLLAFGA